jgi:hypothetical protein
MKPSLLLRLTVIGIAALYLGLLIGFTVGFGGDLPAAAWVGLAVVAVVVSVVAVATIALFERVEMDAGTNAEMALPPAEDGRQRVLVVADVGCEGSEACPLILSRIDRASSPEVLVVAPAIGSPLHHLTDDGVDERATAGRRLDEIVSLLRQEGIRAYGMVGSDVPLEAIQDALAVFPANEIVVLAPPSDRSAWSEHDLVERTRTTFARPVTQVALPRAA